MSQSVPQPASIHVLTVCMGNICRSPTAQGILEHFVAQKGLRNMVRVDSAGTHGYYDAGQSPDARSQQQARARGYDLSAQQARQLLRSDFTKFDWVLVMDAKNERDARALCPPEHQHKIRLLPTFCQKLQVNEVPDPYYSDYEEFENVLDICEDACCGFLDFLKEQHSLR